MSAPLTIHCLDESGHAEWDAFVAGSSQGSVYGSPHYLAALCEAVGGTFRILAARRGGELVGGVAFLETPQGSAVRVAPRPLLYYNGLVLRDLDTKYPSQRTARTLEITAALEAAISAGGYERVVLKQRSSFTDARSFMARGWTVRPGYSYVVPLGDIGQAWERVEQNLRRLVKRGSEQGLRFTEDDDFDSFLRMHLDTMRRKGLSAYLPEARFVRFFQTLRAKDLCRLYHARLPDGRSVSTQFVLTGKHPVSHSVCAATDAAHLNSGVTAFLRWKVFEALSAMGYAGNDLTDAALNPVTHFKSQLGGTLELCLICEKAASPRAFGDRLTSRIKHALGR